MNYTFLVAEMIMSNKTLDVTSIADATTKVSDITTLWWKMAGFKRFFGTLEARCGVNAESVR